MEREQGECVSRIENKIRPKIIFDKQIAQINIGKKIILIFMKKIII